MEAAEHEVQVTQRARIHVTIAAGIQIQFERMQNLHPQCFGSHGGIHRVDLLGLFAQLLLVDSAGNL